MTIHRPWPLAEIAARLIQEALLQFVITFMQGSAILIELTDHVSKLHFRDASP